MNLDYRWTSLSSLDRSTRGWSGSHFSSNRLTKPSIAVLSVRWVMAPCVTFKNFILHLCMILGLPKNPDCTTRHQYTTCFWSISLSHVTRLTGFCILLMLLICSPTLYSWFTSLYRSAMIGRAKWYIDRCCLVPTNSVKSSIGLDVIGSIISPMRYRWVHKNTTLLRLLP